MRPMIALVAAATATFFTSSCDTTQPLQLEQQTFELAFTAFGVQTLNYNVYDGFEDSNGDGLADDTNGDGAPDFFRHCLTRDPNAQQARVNTASVPWGFSVLITILRAGQTEPERITSSAATTDPSFSVTTYDSSNSPLAAVPPAPSPVTIQGRTFRFQNGRILSSARREVVSQTTSPLIELDPGTYGAVGSGRCSAFDPGPSVVDRGTSSTYPRQIVLRKGDTVTIEAFVSPTPTPGIVVFNPLSAPGLAATFTLDGTPMTVRGSIAETSPGDGLRFAYTTQ